MKCPHCNVEINEDFKQTYLGNDPEGHHSCFYMWCPSPDCKKLIVKIVSGNKGKDNGRGFIIGVLDVIKEYYVKPISSTRKPVPSEVDKEFAEDYKEACLVLAYSAKASAALSRRCLQNILREKAKVRKGNLSNEIQEIIDSNSLPTYLSKSIDAIRNIGNFAAHPSKSNTTGEIIEVEHGEAEWLLDVLESLFDFYFVQPKIIEEKRNALNVKLSQLGKPELK